MCIYPTKRLVGLAGLVVLLLLVNTGCGEEEAPATTQAAESTSAPNAVDPPQEGNVSEQGSEEMMMEQSLPSHPGATPYPPELVQKLSAELIRLGPSYKPRTKHFKEDGSPEYMNRLLFERSPYLRQHAHNPVNWRPWGDEAFETARAEEKPVLLSVGYATCHWCHVMEEESFEDLEIATYLNENYICVKVDREERPDVDGVYMSAVHLMRRRGGWPMTVWLTPSRQPFMAGTYFPPRDGARGRAKGFLTLIRELRQEFTTDPMGVANKASQIAYQLQRSQNNVPANSSLPDEGALHNAVKGYERIFDSEFGGFGTGNKFPRSSNLDFLMRYVHRTGSESARKMVLKTLDAMKDGGLYDHVDYGFHRYTTERRFRIPHFEKMLYDNAQLVVTYLEALQLFGDKEYERVARETLDYVIRDMTSPEGGFYSATDADSEGEEGIFAIWRPEDVIAAAGKDDGKILNAYFNVSPRGNFEHGTTVLHTTRSKKELATELAMDQESLESAIERGLKKMFDVRRGRIQPLKDDKVLTGWNGLMISAFARAGLVLNEEKYISTARRAAEFVLTHLKKDGRLLRRYHSGESRFGGVLDDYAYLIAGLLDLYEADPNPRWIGEAKYLQSVVDKYFADPGGSYFMTPSDGEALLVRERPDYDGARPSSNSVTALNLLRLNALTTDDEYRANADLTLGRFGQALSRGTTGLPKLASALDFRLDRSLEVVLVAPEGGDAEALLDIVRNTFLPNRVLVRMKDGEGAGSLVKAIPIISGKTTMNGKATAYVCEMGACLKPTTDPKEFGRQLAQMKQAL